jgi:hypothetical protein
VKEPQIFDGHTRAIFVVFFNPIEDIFGQVYFLHGKNQYGFGYVL